MAHRVLGDGRQGPLASLRHPLRRDGPHLPPPRERNRPERSGLGRAIRSHVDAHGLSQRRHGEDEQIARKLRDDCADPRTQRRRGAALLAARRALPYAGELRSREARRRAGRLSGTGRGRTPRRVPLHDPRGSGRVRGRGAPGGRRRRSAGQDVTRGARARLHRARQRPEHVGGVERDRGARARRKRNRAAGTQAQEGPGGARKRAGARGCHGGGARCVLRSPWLDAILGRGVFRAHTRAQAQASRAGRRGNRSQSRRTRRRTRTEGLRAGRRDSRRARTGRRRAAGHPWWRRHDMEGGRVVHRRRYGIHLCSVGSFASLRMTAVALCALCGCRSHAARLDSSDGEASPLSTAEPAPEARPIADAAATLVIAALKYQTPIFSRPEFPPRDPGRSADEKTQVIRLGSLRKGQRIPARGSSVKTGGCAEGWFELPDGGFVCGRFATVDFSNKELQSAPHTPYADGPLPYTYGLNLTNGTPMYRRPPLRRERATYEKGLFVAGKTDEDRTSAAKEIAAEKGETPWYLADNPQRANVTLDDLKGESALVEQRMVRGFYVALDQEVHAFAGKFWRTTRGNYIPFDHILVHQP